MQALTFTKAVAGNWTLATALEYFAGVGVQTKKPIDIIGIEYTELSKSRQYIVRDETAKSPRYSEYPFTWFTITVSETDAATIAEWFNYELNEFDAIHYGEWTEV